MYSISVLNCYTIHMYKVKKVNNFIWLWLSGSSREVVSISETYASRIKEYFSRILMRSSGRFSFFFIDIGICPSIHGPFMTLLFRFYNHLFCYQALENKPGQHKANVKKPVFLFETVLKSSYHEFPLKEAFSTI